MVYSTCWSDSLPRDGRGKGGEEVSIYMVHGMSGRYLFAINTVYSKQRNQAVIQTTTKGSYDLAVQEQLES